MTLNIPARGLLAGREIPEWIGKSENTNIPIRVRLRVSLRFSLKDAITGLPLRKGWHMDHKTALRDWVKTDEYPHGNVEHNLQPVNADVNTTKAALENSDRKKITRIQRKQIHIEMPKVKIQSKPFRSNPKPDKGAGFSRSHAAHLEAMKLKGLR